MDTYDQREILTKLNSQNAAHPAGQSYRMMQVALGRAAFGNSVLVLVDGRKAVVDLNTLIPDYLSRYITVRCIESHPDLNWLQWSVPGWEDHVLFVDHAVLEKKFPQFVSMLKY